MDDSVKIAFGNHASLGRCFPRLAGHIENNATISLRGRGLRQPRQLWYPEVSCIVRRL